MKPTQEQVMDMMKECNLIEIVARHDDGTVTAQIPNITNMKRFAALFYEAGRKDENEACASLEVHLITPTRDYTTMSPLDCYEAALMDEAMAFRAAIRARREQ